MGTDHVVSIDKMNCFLTKASLSIYASRLELIHSPDLWAQLTRTWPCRRATAGCPTWSTTCWRPKRRRTRVRTTTGSGRWTCCNRRRSCRTSCGERFKNVQNMHEHNWRMISECCFWLTLVGKVRRARASEWGWLRRRSTTRRGDQRTPACKPSLSTWKNTRSERVIHHSQPSRNTILRQSSSVEQYAKREFTYETQTVFTICAAHHDHNNILTSESLDP